MFIHWLGHKGLKLQSGEFIMTVDPDVKDFGFSNPRIKANLILASNLKGEEEDLPSYDESTFVVSKAGEYEVGGVMVRAIDLSDGQKDAALCFQLKIEDINIAILSGVVSKTLPSFAAEILEGNDVLLIPVGGFDVLDGKQAADLASKLEAKIIIPFQYAVSEKQKSYSDEKEFVKAFSIKPEGPLPKLTLKTKDLPEEGSRVILLETATS